MNRKGFTLIELLVVIAIVGILSSVIYTNITGLRDRARITAGIQFDSSTLHSIGDQLAGEWLFDISTNPLADTSGMGNNGSTTTAPTYSSAGGYNNKGAYSFDGNDDYIFLGTDLEVSASAITVSAWIKPSIAQRGSIVSKNGPFALEYSLTSQRMTGWVFINSTWYGVTNSTNLSLNTWYQTTLTYDGSNVKIYVNGNLEGTTAIAGSIINNYAAGVYIGGSAQLGFNYFFGGLIDNVRIYTSALSSSDVEKLYAEGKASHVMAAK
ncbi:MAG: LamG-like jellyroll fold domain-containing protein [Candidatus Paceibacterota bacterium]|jgi:prepilin-type N-terminal cleavage/methylation domain-containing protein